MIYILDKTKYREWRAYGHLGKVIREEIAFEDDDIVFWASSQTPKIKNVIRCHGKICGDKPAMRRIFEEKGVPHPKTWFSIKDAKYPCIARPKRHMMCRRFHVIESPWEEKQGWYYSEILDVDKEYRVHVLFDRITGAWQKPIKETIEETIKFRRENPIGSPARRTQVEKLPNEWEDVCKEAVKACEMDFGGVDLIISNNKPYVIEVNSPPIPRIASDKRRFTQVMTTHLYDIFSHK